MKITTDHNRRQSSLNQPLECIDPNKQPVCHHDQAFNAAIDQHLQITSKTIAVIVRVHDHWEVVRRLQAFVNPPQYESAERIGKVEHYHADCIAALTTQRAGKNVGPITQTLGHFANPATGITPELIC